MVSAMSLNFGLYASRWFGLGSLALNVRVYVSPKGKHRGLNG